MRIRLQQKIHQDFPKVELIRCTETDIEDGFFSGRVFLEIRKWRHVSNHKFAYIHQVLNRNWTCGGCGGGSGGMPRGSSCCSSSSSVIQPDWQDMSAPDDFQAKKGMINTLIPLEVTTKALMESEF
ncbi:uncharacterized protein V6R79_015562 [Siganus canaliculatus]